MKKATEKALRKSIAHWERLRDGKRRGNEDTGEDHCALCSRFGFSCCTYALERCPVYDRTGVFDCSESPYVSASGAREDHGLDSDQFKKAAAKEVEFLKSLLPGAEK